MLEECRSKWNLGGFDKPRTRSADDTTIEDDWYAFDTHVLNHAGILNHGSVQTAPAIWALKLLFW